MDNIESITPKLLGNFNALIAIFYCHAKLDGNFESKEFRYKDQLRKKPPMFFRYDYLIILNDMFCIFTWEPSAGRLYSVKYSDINNLQLERTIINGSINDGFFRIDVKSYPNSAYEVLNRNLEKHNISQMNNIDREVIIGGGLTNELSVIKKNNLFKVSPAGFLVTDKRVFFMDKQIFESEIWKSYRKGAVAGLFVFSALTGPLAAKMKEAEIFESLRAPNSINILEQNELPFIMKNNISEIKIKRGYGDLKRTHIEFCFNDAILPEYGGSSIDFYHNGLMGAQTFYGVILPLLREIISNINFFEIRIPS